MDRSLDEIISERKIGRRISQNKQSKNLGARANVSNNTKKQRPTRNRNTQNEDARLKIQQRKRKKLLISDARELINQKLVAQGHDARELLFRKRDREGSRRNIGVDARSRISQGSRQMEVNPTMLRREIVNDQRGLSRDQYYEEEDELMDYSLTDINPMSVKITTRNNLARAPRPKSLRITTTNYGVKKKWPSDDSSSLQRRYRDDSPIYGDRSRASPVSRKSYDRYSSSKSKSQGIFHSLPSSSKPVAYKVVITNLHDSVSQEDISELFSEMGYVESSRVVPGGMAEVVYESRTDAERAVEEYNKRQLDGVAMQCRMVPVYREASKGVMRGDAGVSPDVGLIHRALFKKPNMKLSSSRPGLH